MSTVAAVAMGLLEESDKTGVGHCVVLIARGRARGILRVAIGGGRDYLQGKRNIAPMPYQQSRKKVVSGQHMKKTHASITQKICQVLTDQESNERRRAPFSERRSFSSFRPSTARYADVVLLVQTALPSMIGLRTGPLMSKPREQYCCQDKYNPQTWHSALVAGRPN